MNLKDTNMFDPMPLNVQRSLEVERDRFAMTAAENATKRWCASSMHPAFCAPSHGFFVQMKVWVEANPYHSDEGRL